MLCMCVCVVCNSTKLNFRSCFDKTMTTLQDIFNKLYSARAKLEINNIYGEINNSVDKQDRKVKTVKCKYVFTIEVDKSEDLVDLA